MLYTILLILTVCLWIGAVATREWITYRENQVEITHGLFHTCLDKDNKDEEDEVSCEYLRLDNKYNIYLPTAMILSSFGAMCFAQLLGGFLYFIVGTHGTRIIGFWIIGVFNILAGLVIIAASALVIRLPLLDDDAIVFAKELGRILEPRKVYRKGFFIGWAAGLTLLCSGIVAISSASRGHYRYIESKIRKK